MTTTSTFQGLGETKKTSSRVLNAPGGASNNIFGFATEDSSPPQRKQATPKAEPASQQPPPNATNEPARRTQRTAVNPITGEPLYPQAKPQESTKTEEESKSEENGEVAKSTPSVLPAAGRSTQEHTSTRVSQPPGGTTHKLW